MELTSEDKARVTKVIVSDLRNVVSVNMRINDCIEDGEPPSWTVKGNLAGQHGAMYFTYITDPSRVDRFGEVGSVPSWETALFEAAPKDTQIQDMLNPDTPPKYPGGFDPNYFLKRSAFDRLIVGKVGDILIGACVIVVIVLALYILIR